MVVLLNSIPLKPYFTFFFFTAFLTVIASFTSLSVFAVFAFLASFAAFIIQYSLLTFYIYYNYLADALPVFLFPQNCKQAKPYG